MPSHERGDLAGEPAPGGAANGGFKAVRVGRAADAGSVHESLLVWLGIRGRDPRDREASVGGRDSRIAHGSRKEAFAAPPRRPKLLRTQGFPAEGQGPTISW